MKSLSAAIYARLSKEDDLDITNNSAKHSNSIENQIVLIQNYIASHLDLRQYELVEYCDDGYSGTDFRRPRIQQLLSDVKCGKIQCILVKDFSRFGRNYLEVGTYIEEVFPLLGVRFISVNDHYDNQYYHYDNQYYHPYVNSIDIAVRNIMYDYYSKDLSQKVKASFTIKQEKGYYLGGGIPYGYCRSQKEKGKIVIEKEAAEIVRRIFQMTKDGYSRSEIARILNESGVPAPADQIRKHTSSLAKSTFTEANTPRKEFYWTLDAIIRILRNQVYIGTTVNKKYKVKEIGSRKTVLLPKDEWNHVLNTHKGIVSQELFASVQQTFRRQNPKLVRNRNTHEVGMLKGKIKCGVCQYSMDLIQGKNPYYQCTSRRFIPDTKCTHEHVLCKVIEGSVLTFLSVYQNVFCSDDAIQRIDPKTKSTDSDVERARKQIQLKEAKLYNNYKNKLLGQEEYLRKKELQRKKQYIHSCDSITLALTEEKNPSINYLIKAIYFYDAKHMEIVISKKDPCELIAIKKI